MVGNVDLEDVVCCVSKFGKVVILVLVIFILLLFDLFKEDVKFEVLFVKKKEGKGVFVFFC